MNYIEEKEKIKEKILKTRKVRPGQSISYIDFQELYEPYKERMNEKEFAEILGISYANHSSMKNGGTRARILKDKQKEITDEEKEEIIEKILKTRKIRAGQSISYKDFQELYESYKERMNEKEFAEILGISYDSYRNIKDRGTRARVLKNKQEEMLKEEREKIIEEILKARKVRAGQPILYKEFQELYELYKDRVSEKEFAEILGMSYASYRSIKSGGIRARALKNKQEEMLEEEREKIIEEILKARKVRAGQPILYKEFQELYQLYKDRMSEKEFAEILGINFGNYRSIKNKGTRARVLKNKQKELTQEEREEIIEEILKAKKIRAGQLIEYIKLQELYNPYKYKMSEKEFAEVLGISNNSYIKLKNKRTRAIILKDKKREMTDEEKEKIINEIVKKEKVSIGQLISYKDFQELYNPYKDEISEKEFAGVLGMSYDSYIKIKSKGCKAKVHNFLYKAKIDKIRYLLKKESRYYTKQELEKLSKENDIAIDTIMKYCWCSGKEKYVQITKELLEQEGKIYIGDQRCSQQFANKHSKVMIESAKKSSITLSVKYDCKNIIQDFASDALEYVLEKCGDIEKNFNNNDEVASRIIMARIYLYIKHRCLAYLQKPKEFSFHREFTYKGNRGEESVFDSLIEDKSINIQDEVEEKVLNEIKKKHEKNPEEICIELLMKNIEIGLARDEAIRRTGEILGISPNEMLKSLQKYMIEKKKVRKTHDGEFVLGE